MRTTLLAAALALSGAAALADEPKPARPAQPAVQPRAVLPAQPRIAQVTAARMAQLEEEVEVLEAQRDIRKGHIKVAEAGARVAEIERRNNAGLLDKGVVGKDELAIWDAKAQAARAQVEIRQAELKEVEVKLKYARKRLDDAKAAGVRPAPGLRPLPALPKATDPLVGNARPAAPDAELRAQFEALVAEDEGCVVQLKLAALARDVAEQSLEKLRAAAKAGRIQTSTVTGAEAVLADAQKKLDNLLANHKTYRATIEALLKKLEPQEK